MNPKPIDKFGKTLLNLVWIAWNCSNYVIFDIKIGYLY